jgi:hypothetical protein
VDDGKDATIGLFLQNFGCSAEQKTFGIPFQTIMWKIEIHGILCSGTKIEANSRNSFSNHSWKRKMLENSVPIQSAEEKTTWNSIPWNKNRSKLSEFFCVFPFHFIPIFGIDSSVVLGMPRNEQFLPRNNKNGSKSIPRKFFRNEIPLPTLMGRYTGQCGNPNCPRERFSWTIHTHFQITQPGRSTNTRLHLYRGAFQLTTTQMTVVTSPCTMYMFITSSVVKEEDHYIT